MPRKDRAHERYESRWDAMWLERLGSCALDPSALVDDAEGRALQAAGLARVRAAVDQLPEGLRVVVELRYWARESHRQIGRRLGLAASSVMRRERRALVMLEDLLGGLDDE